MNGISEAVILMAGEGSRLRGGDNILLKPFIPVLGRPLISYTIDLLMKAKDVTLVIDHSGSMAGSFDRRDHRRPRRLRQHSTSAAAELRRGETRAQAVRRL